MGKGNPNAIRRNMKYIIALLLMTQMVMADGVVVFHKPTGLLYGSDNGFRKLQPKEARADGDRVLGAQIAKRIDWTLYDLARFDTASDNPQTTNDLTGVVRQYVYEEQTETHKQKMDGDDLKNLAESNIVAIATSLGLTNQPVKWTRLSNKITDVLKTNAVQGLILGQEAQQWLLFYSFNGGDPWKIGSRK